MTVVMDRSHMPLAVSRCGAQNTHGCCDENRSASWVACRSRWMLERRQRAARSWSLAPVQTRDAFAWDRSMGAADERRGTGRVCSLRQRRGDPQPQPHLVTSPEPSCVPVTFCLPACLALPFSLPLTGGRADYRLQADRTTGSSKAARRMHCRTPPREHHAGTQATDLQCSARRQEFSCHINPCRRCPSPVCSFDCPALTQVT